MGRAGGGGAGAWEGVGYVMPRLYGLMGNVLFQVRLEPIRHVRLQAAGAGPIEGALLGAARARLS